MTSFRGSIAGPKWRHLGHANSTCVPPNQKSNYNWQANLFLYEYWMNIHYFPSLQESTLTYQTFPTNIWLGRKWLNMINSVTFYNTWLFLAVKHFKLQSREKWQKINKASIIIFLITFIESIFCKRRILQKCQMNDLVHNHKTYLNMFLKVLQ